MLLFEFFILNFFSIISLLVRRILGVRIDYISQLILVYLINFALHILAFINPKQTQAIKVKLKVNCTLRNLSDSVKDLMSSSESAILLYILKFNKCKYHRIVVTYLQKVYTTLSSLLLFAITYEHQNQPTILYFSFVYSKAHLIYVKIFS